MNPKNLSRHYGRLPFDARIHVDHSKRHVCFDYPKSEKPMSLFYQIFLLLFVYWMGVFALSMAGYAIGNGLHFAYTHPIQWSITAQDVQGLKGGIALLSFFFLPPLLIAWIFARHYNYFHRVVSRLTYVLLILNDLAGVRYYTQTLTRLDGMTYIIPAFQNYLLEYETEGEFAKYLETVDVQENTDVHVYIGKRRRHHTHLWRATLKFSQPPLSGMMKIKWR